VIDLHSHILPGLDDGARTLEEARELARQAAADGVTVVAATPHVRADYPTRPEEMEVRVEQVRRDFAEQGIGIDVLHGAEIALDMLDRFETSELRRFSLGQGGRYLVLEFPYQGWPLGLTERVFSLQLDSFVPVIAHPERNSQVQADPARLGAAVRAGALVQLTAASLDGRLGRAPRKAGERLLELGLAHLLASDAHAPEVREAGLGAAARSLRDPRLARYLTVEAPAAMVAGEPVPAPPPRRRRGLFAGRRATRR
jgi:protein-tyrosine phosphatase